MGRARGDGVLSPEREALARELYEAGELTVQAIAGRLGVSKNVIVGLARRHWTQRSTRIDCDPPTLLDRMDALAANMDRMLAECPPGLGRVPPPEPRKGPKSPMRPYEMRQGSRM